MGAVAGEFMGVAKPTGGEWLFADPARMVFQVMFLVGLGLCIAKVLMFGIFASVLKNSAALATSLCIGRG